MSPMKWLSSLAILLLATCSLAQERMRPTHQAVAFAEVDGQKLALDLYLPQAKEPALLVWVHGGAWRGGSRANPPLGFLVEQG